MLSSVEEKLEPLRTYLASKQNHDVVRLTFQEIEAVLGAPLPDSAYQTNEAWWTNQRGPSFPQSSAWLEAGFSISAVAYETARSGWAEFARGVDRWPGVSVSSEDFLQKPVDKRFHELALGYLQSAKTLCILLGENPDELSWPRACVITYCYLLSVELFLKSCILHRISTIDQCSHNISKLRKQYYGLYPQPEFQFQTPYDFSLDDLDELFGMQVALVEEFERKPDQLFRYMSDKKGRSPKGRYFFAPGTYFILCERLEKDISRIWGRIRELDGK
jgi:hypothetical protein